MISHRPHRGGLCAAAVITLVTALAAPAAAARGESAGALLELANAYISTGEPGRAILALERARAIAPRDADVAQNLARARANAGVPPPDVSWVERAADHLTADEWTWIGVGGVALACAGLVVLGWSSRRRLAATLATAGALSVAFAGPAAWMAAPDPDAAIVVAPTTARIAPFDAAEPAFEALAGTSVEIVQRRGDELFVRSGDRAGWMRSKDVVPIASDEG